MRFICSIIVLLCLAACNYTYTSLLSEKGETLTKRYRDSDWETVYFGNREVDGFLAVFRLAVPLDREGPAASKTDLIFTYRVDGKAVSEFILYRDGELFHDGKWFIVDKDWLYRWQSNHDPRNSRKPNHALQNNNHGCHGSCLRTLRASFGRG